MDLYYLGLLQQVLKSRSIIEAVKLFQQRQAVLPIPRSGRTAYELSGLHRKNMVDSRGQWIQDISKKHVTCKSDEKSYEVYECLVFFFAIIQEE